MDAESAQIVINPPSKRPEHSFPEYVQAYDRLRRIEAAKPDHESEAHASDVAAALADLMKVSRNLLPQQMDDVRAYHADIVRIMALESRQLVRLAAIERQTRQQLAEAGVLVGPLPDGWPVAMTPEQIETLAGWGYIRPSFGTD